jgi:hypothetical protein
VAGASALIEFFVAKNNAFSKRNSMDMPHLRRSVLVLGGIFTLALGGWAAAEPPSRAARLGYISGTVSFSPAGQPDWVHAMVNRPLTTGDRLWSDANSRAELQIGGAALRLGEATSVTVLNLDDRITQLQLSQGTLKVRVRRMGPNQSFEVDTPNLAFTLRRPGEYRIDVNANDDATAVMVQSGEAEVYGDGASYTVNSRQGYRFYGTDLSDYDLLGARRDDGLDRWARERDRRADHSPSARYVSSEVIGYEDLDSNGTWRADPNYGNVWMPNHVAAGWTPYHDGHWAWVDPWGWTWVDDAPWGFAVSHYGRWANIRGAWGWVPGPQREQAVYAPALVAFVGGKNFQVSVSVGSNPAPAVAWFPLAPREVYQPSYAVSRSYFDDINRSNAVIAPTVIATVYSTTNITNNSTTVNNTTNVVYINQQVPGAVVAVPTQAFVQSQSVAKVAMVVSKEAAISAPVVHVAAVVPVQQSVHGGATDTGAKPPARELAVVARTAPPAPPVPFAVQQTQLAAKTGAPIDETQRTQLKPAAAAVEAPKVSVVTAAKAPAPTAPPPTAAPALKTPEARKVEAAKADAGRSDTAKGDAGKADAARAASLRAEADKADASKAANEKAASSKAEAAKAEAARADAVKAEASRADATKAATAKVESSKVEAAKAEAVKAEAAKVEASKAEAARAEIARVDADKADAAKIDANKAASAKAEAAKADGVKADIAKSEVAKAAAARAESSRAEAVKAEAARGDAARAATAKAEEAKAEAARAATAKAEAAKADAAKSDAAKAAAARAESSRAEAVKAEAARGDAARAATAKAEEAKAEAARAATAKAEAAKADAAKSDAAKAAAARAESSRAETVKAEEARANAAKAEATRATAAKADEARGNAAKVDAARNETPKRDPAKAEGAGGNATKPDVLRSPNSPNAGAPKPEPDAKTAEERKKKKAEEDIQNR